MKQVTLKELLNKLPEPVRSQAIKNTTNDRLELTFRPNYNPYIALSSAFHWEKSPEGFEYWHEQFRKQDKCEICTEEIKPVTRVAAGFRTCLTCSDLVTQKTTGHIILDKYDNPYTVLNNKQVNEIGQSNE